MKKVICMLMTFLMALGAVGGLAETADTLTVGGLTPATGSFFLDDLFGNNTTDMDIRDLLHGYPLTEWDAETGTYIVNGNVVSGIIAMDTPEGNRIYEIALRRDLAYSDGTPITAWDYAFSVLLSIAPEMEAIGAVTDRSDRLLGAAAYQAGETAYFAGAEVVEDYLLHLTVRGEYLPYFYELALLSYKPYPIHSIAPGCKVIGTEEGITIRAADGSENNPFTAELLADTILDPDHGYLTHPDVVSGPYKMVSFDRESARVELTVNGYYQGNSAGILPRIRNLVFTPVTADESVAGLKNGEIGLFNKAVKAKIVDEGMAAVTENGMVAETYPRMGLGFLGFACEKPEVADSTVRQAVALCFERDSFIRDYAGGNGVKVDGYYGIGQWMYTAAVSKTAAYPVTEPAEDATAEEKRAHEADKAAWEELSADNVRTYELNVEAAKKLLDDNGWMPGNDGIRSKEIDGQTVRLELTLVCSAGNGIGTLLERDLGANLANAGVGLRVMEIPAGELFAQYYGTAEREGDLFFLASNFVTDFDPSGTFMPGSSANHTGIRDEELYNRTVELRKTEAGSVTAYCEKWISFQERFMEVLPMIPIYSNVYFDFHTPALRDYEIGTRGSLGQALAEAYLEAAE